MHWVKSTVLAAIVVLTPALAGAQDHQRFGDWVLVCDGGQPCRLIQQQTISESGELALRIIAIKTEEGGVMAVQVPMGVHLPSGAVYRLRTPESEPQRQMIWQRCQSDVCEAAIQLDARELDLFSATDALLFAYRQNPQDEPRIIQVRLAGFMEGLERTGG